MHIGIGVHAHSQLERMRISLRPENEMSGQGPGVVVDDEIDAFDRPVALDRQTDRHQRGVKCASRRIDAQPRTAVLYLPVAEQRMLQLLPALGPLGLVAVR